MKDSGLFIKHLEKEGGSQPEDWIKYKKKFSHVISFITICNEAIERSPRNSLFYGGIRELET